MTCSYCYCLLYKSVFQSFPLGKLVQCSVSVAHNVTFVFSSMLSVCRTQSDFVFSSMLSDCRTQSDFVFSSMLSDCRTQSDFVFSSMLSDCRTHSDFV